jgi:hypothetical protein
MSRSRLGRTGAAAVLVVAMTAGAVTAALAGTRTGSPAGRLRTAGGWQAAAALPGALAVAQSSSAAGTMDHPLAVRVQGWARARAGCAAVTGTIPDSRSALANPHRCATPFLTAKRPPGYSPRRLRAYLKLHGDGAGQRVAIVDAFDDPYLQRDLTMFSQEFGLPLPCAPGQQPGGHNCFTLSVLHPYGISGVDAGWALESDLDIEMVHEIAPDASITLVEAYDDSTVSLFEAIRYAAALSPRPSVINGSWGQPEFSGETAGNTLCELAKTLCVFSTGDGGNPGEFPAYNPYVLSVGGTTLELGASGQVEMEAAWCCNLFDGGAGGGGVSKYEVRPAYQNGADPYLGRAIPDVSFDADPATGVPVYDTLGLDDQNGWFMVGGTSVGAPAWSGIIADADQLRAAAGRPPLAGAGFQAQKLIYAQARRHAAGFGDITIGVDNYTECLSPVRACQTKPGYDEVTGWGSPRPGIALTLAAPTPGTR